jgi:type II secretory pathway component PulL
LQEDASIAEKRIPPDILEIPISVSVFTLVLSCDTWTERDLTNGMAPDEVFIIERRTELIPTRSLV